MLLGRVQAAIARLWLRSVYAKVPSPYVTLLSALKAELQTRLDAVSGGTIVSTGANGHTTTLGPSDRNLNPEDWAETISELLDLYDRSSSVLVSSGIASPTDAQIYAEMMNRLQTVREVRADFTGIRC